MNMNDHAFRKNIGAMLQKLRLASNLTLEEAAEKIGIEVATLKKCENGAFRITLQLFTEILKGLGISALNIENQIIDLASFGEKMEKSTTENIIFCLLQPPIKEEISEIGVKYYTIANIMDKHYNGAGDAIAYLNKKNELIAWHYGKSPVTEMLENNVQIEPAMASCFQICLKNMVHLKRFLV